MVAGNALQQAAVWQTEQFFSKERHQATDRHAHLKLTAKLNIKQRDFCFALKKVICKTPHGHTLNLHPKTPLYPKHLATCYFIIHNKNEEKRLTHVAYLQLHLDLPGLPSC